MCVVLFPELQSGRVVSQDFVGGCCVLVRVLMVSGGRLLRAILIIRLRRRGLVRVGRLC